MKSSTYDDSSGMPATPEKALCGSVSAKRMVGEATLCPQCDPHSFAVCDFCKHYAFNGDEDGHYTGDGWCTLHRRDQDPGGGCERFHCHKAS
jgi:hypothetical protein